MVKKLQKFLIWGEAKSFAVWPLGAQYGFTVNLAVVFITWLRNNLGSGL